ncbi:isochorismatase family protein [Sinorhizobium numidicum]|uniref:Isochorismatase family protein n=1 Tax=Sinorhizobium numidicum TaxID=680248 RepID=A0ABY8CW76_9HYPH|nr:isochorismatase family protein [Sinorhizobium numidicum]WEX76232.1 isochorismatase family protein [Sinorhizobium numidicum]WEX82891.1 isochorismatase family protein [Sinorhizobium numidicum]
MTTTTLSATTAATYPATLFSLAGREPVPPALSEATLILIDYQNEYLAGPLALVGAEAAVERARALLAAARRAGTRIVHVAHKGAPGSFFDRAAERGAFIDTLAPLPTEAIVEKPRPNAFSGTALADLVGPPGAKIAGAKIIIAGFMTHNCVSSTARAALDLGYEITIAGDACATRDLPFATGIVSARDLHVAELAALADRHACVTDVAALIEPRR